MPTPSPSDQMNNLRFIVEAFNYFPLKRSICRKQKGEIFVPFEK